MIHFLNIKKRAIIKNESRPCDQGTFDLTFGIPLVFYQKQAINYKPITISKIHCKILN